MLREQLGAKRLLFTDDHWGRVMRRIGSETEPPQLGSREKHGLRPLLGPEPAVSGSDTPGLDGQNPAESREFLGLFLDEGGKSLQPQTEWRWAQSGANPSLGARSLFGRENTGNSLEASFRGDARFSRPSPFRGLTRLVP